MDGNFDELANAEPIVVRKYKNRRIYDTRRRCYVTLDDLQQGLFGDILAGLDVFDDEGCPLDHHAAQIVVGEEQRFRPLMPVGFLSDVIRFYGEISAATLRLYLDASMNAFIINQKQIRQLLATLQSEVFENPLYGLQGAKASRSDTDADRPNTILGAASELALAVLESNIRALEGQLHSDQTSAQRSAKVPSRISED